MVDKSVLYGSLIYTLAAVAASTCLAVVVAYRSSPRNRVPNNLMGITIFSYSLSLFCTVCLILYLISPKLFVILQSIFYLAFTLWQVCLYRIIFLLTGTGEKEDFSVFHYIPPAIMPAILFVWSFFVPMSSQIFIVESRGQLAPGYEAYSTLFLSKAPALLLWNATYAMLSLRRIIKYRGEVSNFSADEGRSPVRWMMNLFWLKIFMLSFPIIDFFFGKSVLMGSLVMIMPVFLIIMQLLLLCYNMVAENYVLISDNGDLEKENKGRKTRQLARERLEQYVKQKKPYLNPELRITDLALDVRTNRTYLSNLINTEYGMNFSRWINRHRLEELEKLRIDPEFSHLKGMELVMLAGFSNYRAYIRVKNEEDRLRKIKDI